MQKFTHTILRRLLAIVLFSTLLSPCIVHSQDRLRDVIDKHISAAWKAKDIQPAAMSTDAAFLRRVYLDLTGVIPSYEEATAFLSDNAGNKREQLVDRLLQQQRFGVHQADVWDMVYFGRNPPGYGTDKRDGFKKWLQQQFNKNVPYDQWAGAILRAGGNTVEDGAPMFFVQYKNSPEDAAQAITQKFMGMQLQCARCHDHPFDRWTQLDFYGMAAFYARLEIVDVGKKNKVNAYVVGEKNLGDVLFSGPAAQQEPGKKGEPVKPKFLGGDALVETALPKDFNEPRNFPKGKAPPAPEFSRKDKLADWITSHDNPYFARAAANRIWAQFMGKGLVDPVDNLSSSNPPSHPQLLAALTRSLVEHDFDLKWFIREIVNSRTYQLSANAPGEAAKPEWYERARYRPLSSEELLESWVRACGYDEVLKASNQKPDGRFNVRGIGWTYIVKAFGQPDDGAGNFQGGMHEHLYLNNGQVRQLVSDRPGSLHATISKSGDAWRQRVERLFVQVLSRRPTPDETKKFSEFLQADDDSRGRLHDAIWTLMTCSEFRFNN